jgi:branched-chain amino acid transport system ATP-binding protein
MLLEVKELRVHYGPALALDKVSISVDEGSVVAVLGANGAGKTTLLRTISGLKKPSSGEVWFGRSRIDGLSPVEVVKAGITHVPEGRKLFPDLTVLQNLLLGASARTDKEEIEKDMETVFEYFPRLRERKEQKAKTLSGGEQQMLAIGRGLMAKPRLLLLDEPSLGLAPRTVEELGNIMKHISEKEGVTILLVEQNVGLASRLASRAYVLQVGRVVLEGKMEDLAASDTIRRAYLGGFSKVNTS